MNLGKTRFEFQLEKIKPLLAQASAQENPALWLFLHDLRTPFFMLEGLAKLYAELHDKKTFAALKDDFKSIEDALGGIDYYVGFARDYAPLDRVPGSVKRHLDEKIREKTRSLNALLKKEGWLDGSRMKKIRKKIKDADWKNDEKETSLLAKFYRQQIGKIEDFAAGTGFVFDNVEEDVHELRRRLRWLSIYPQALRGAVKLEESRPVARHLKKYLTPAVVQSPFNQLVVAENEAHFLVFEKNRFLALSWMIAELGRLKDQGLAIKAIKDAVQATDLLNDAAALEKAHLLIEKGHPTTEDLLKKAGEIAQQFFAESNLAQLLKSSDNG